MIASGSEDPYAVLGIAPTRDEALVKSAYRSAAKECHPDIDRSDAAAARFLAISRAFDVLKSESGRSAAYDRWKAKPERAGESSPSFDRVFDYLDTHGRGTERRPKRDKRRGQDKRVVLTITLERAFTGGEVLIPGAHGQCLECGGGGTMPTRMRPECPDCGGYGHTRIVSGFTSVQAGCKTCRGHGVVDFILCSGCAGSGRSDRSSTVIAVPPGCNEGFVFTIEGRGHHGRQGGPSGDLIAEIAISDHSRFRRLGENLETDIEVAVWEAALGGKVEVVGIDGRRMTITLPAGSQAGTRLSLRGQGMPAYPGRGNLVAVVKVAVPTADTPAIKAAYLALESAVSSALKSADTSDDSPASPIS